MGSGILPCRGKFSCLYQREVDGLKLVVSDEEIYQAMFDMDLLKALGIGGFHVKFF